MHRCAQAMGSFNGAVRDVTQSSVPAIVSEQQQHVPSQHHFTAGRAMSVVRSERRHPCLSQCCRRTRHIARHHRGECTESQISDVYLQQQGRSVALNCIGQQGILTTGAPRRNCKHNNNSNSKTIPQKLASNSAGCTIVGRNCQN